MGQVLVKRSRPCIYTLDNPRRLILIHLINGGVEHHCVCEDDFERRNALAGFVTRNARPGGGAE